MIVKKILETYLDLEIPEYIFASNIDDICIQLLTKKFGNKCYKSCYILKINKIIRSSRRYMSESLSGNSSICVLFEVDAIVYQEGDIINNCKITKIEPNGKIYAESQYANIQTNQDQSLPIFKEEYIIPVIATNIRNFPSKDKISISAIPFMPMFPQLIIYSVKTPLEEQQIPQLENMLKMVNDELNKIKKLSAPELKSYNFFKTLIYPFKKEKQFKLDSKSKDFKFNKKQISIKEFMTIKEGLLCRPTELPKHMDQFYYLGNKIDKMGDQFDKINNLIILEESMFNIAYKILTDYLRHLITLRELYENYPNIDIIGKYTDVWKMYNMLKK